MKKFNPRRGRSKTANEQQNNITRTNELPSVLLSVLQETDANTADVSRDFQKELSALLKQDQYKGIESDVIFDQGDYIRVAIGNIASSLIIGGALAMLVLFLFLRNIKSPLIIGVAIPYSVIVTFVLNVFCKFCLKYYDAWRLGTWDRYACR